MAIFIHYRGFKPADSPGRSWTFGKAYFAGKVRPKREGVHTEALRMGGGGGGGPIEGKVMVGGPSAPFPSRAGSFHIIGRGSGPLLSP